MFANSDSRNRSLYQLRRLSHSAAVVATTYDSRGSESVDSWEERREEAVRQGYEDGYAEGLVQAATEAAAMRAEEHQRARTAFGALAKVLRAVQEADQRMRAEMMAAAPKLAFALLEQLLAREVELAINPGREAITRALALDDGIQPVTVRMNPVDIETLGEVSDICHGRELCIVADSFVDPGGVLAEIGRVTVDAQLSSALARVKQVLVGSSTNGSRA